jgi:hypothetical protein
MQVAEVPLVCLGFLGPQVLAMAATPRQVQGQEETQQAEGQVGEQDAALLEATEPLGSSLCYPYKGDN